MKKRRKIAENRLTSEMLILPDGRILVQNLTRPLAGLLRGLNPADKTISLRAERYLKTDL